MKCEKARELFSDHLEMALERPMAVAFERHLAECPACEHDYASFRTTWQMLQSLPEVDPPPGFATDVVMKVRLQREAELRSRTRWQVIWGELFSSKVPARVFAAAVVIFLCAMIILHTPLRNTVAAWLVPAPSIVGLSEDPSAPLPGAWRVGDRAMEWLHSGLSFELAPSSRGNMSVFRLLLKPQGVSGLRVRVYLMEPGPPRFDQEGIARASLISDSTVRDAGQVIPFILGRPGDQQEVITALVQWEHRNKQFTEAVFVPTQMAPMGAAREGTLQIRDTELYSALQQVSATFGVAILASADINAKVTSVAVEDGTADDALYKICTNVGLRWRPLGAQVYIVERRIE